MRAETDVTQLGRRALDLDGWADRSAWGWDSQSGSLFAQLWRDGGDEVVDDEPDVWITPPIWAATSEPIVLARRIAEVTGSPVAVVLDAMACSVLAR
jgi:hypothetical protein